MKTLKECLTTININESKKPVEMEIKREPLKLSITVDEFIVHTNDEFDEYDLNDESQYDEFLEQWDNVTNDGDDFEFVTYIDISILDQFDNECTLSYKATHEVGYPSRTPIKIQRETFDEIGLSKENIKNIISTVHNNFLEGDYAADEVAEALYDYIVENRE